MLSHFDIYECYRCLGKPQKNSSTNGQAIKRWGKGWVIKIKITFFKLEGGIYDINGLDISGGKFLRLPLQMRFFNYDHRFYRINVTLKYNLKMFY